MFSPMNTVATISQSPGKYKWSYTNDVLNIMSISFVQSMFYSTEVKSYKCQNGWNEGIVFVMWQMKIMKTMRIIRKNMRWV